MDTVQPLYQAADLLQLDYVRDTCKSCMAMNVERSTCVDLQLYKFADVFSVDNVLKRCLELIHRNFVEVASSEEFCSLSVNQLTEIISHDELGVTEEITVWEAVVRWVQHSKKERLHHLPSILPHIRFDLLTSDDTAAILEHPLVGEDPGICKVIRNVLQKGNPILKPRHGVTMEMALLYKIEHSSNEILFMNPREGKYISCSYKDEPFAGYSATTVTSDNNIYILETKKESDEEEQLSLFKYNHVKNVWELTGLSSASREPGTHIKYLFEIDQILYYMRDYYTPSRKVRLRKYNQHTNHWQECAQLQLEESTQHGDCAALSCGPHLYFLTSTEVYRYDPTEDRWSKRTAPGIIHQVHSAVAMGTEIFCTDLYFDNTIVYDTESDCWQKLQGRELHPPELDYMDVDPSLFAMENQLHIFLRYTSDFEEDKYRVYVFDRSADSWRDLKATLPNESYIPRACYCPVARISLPYIKNT
ncbi:kelch-like protein 20 [Branchiostoma floridae]|uniref:Kelch-like protein 20 n=1 Tax=Branchiostoma floridae TaxID=7739 RepID=A0A9J7HFW5_BRAFL|nr:kelch-like protein 20 [Branchiostoma floridae]